MFSVRVPSEPRSALLDTAGPTCSSPLVVLGCVRALLGSRPSSVRQLTFRSPGRLEWEDVAPPRLSGDRDALVRPITVATCDLDAAVIAGKAPLPGPFAFGHEFVAEVVEVADGVEV